MNGEKCTVPEELLGNLISLSDAYILHQPAVPCEIAVSLAPPAGAALPQDFSLQQADSVLPRPQADSALQQAAPTTQAVPVSPRPAESSLDSEQPAASIVSIGSVAEKVARCTRCPLCKTRKNTVPGIGAVPPFVLVIGEGPGAEEDARGEPFVGPAGQLLDKMLLSIALSRNTNTFIANMVKCRPPHNRDPLPDEVEACRSFLDAQIHLLTPKAILCVGKVAANNLLGNPPNTTMSSLRGRWFNYQGIPVLATYHPSALLRNADYKRPAWEDLKLFRSRLEELNPNYAVP